MGLIKMAIIGGAGYFAFKKLNEHKQKSQYGHNGHCQNQHQQQQGPYSVQGREMSDDSNIRPQEKQRYHDYEPDYSQKRQANVSEKQLEYPQEQQGYGNEKQEYQKNF